MLEKRGRKSAADRESADIVPIERPKARPEPPPDLSPRAAQAWRDACIVMPARHFGPERLPVLRGYVLHVEFAGLAWGHYQQALQADDRSMAYRWSKIYDREFNSHRAAARHLGLLTVNKTARRVPRYAPTDPWVG